MSRTLQPSLSSATTTPQKRFKTTNFEEAILKHRKSLSLRPTPHPDRPWSLNSLAITLQARFKQTGSMTDLEEAILMHRESLSLCPTPHPDRSDSLNNLANALETRCKASGIQSDLSEATSLRQEAVAMHQQNSILIYVTFHYFLLLQAIFVCSQVDDKVE